MSNSVPVDGSVPPVASSAAIASASPAEAPRYGRRAAPYERDSIDVAFKQSAYPTPYSDQSVPGDRPGHRVRHLGRDYAPQPLTRSHLNNALVVPYVEGITPPDCGEGTAASVNPATHYVLNVKNNGKRHYGEERGAEAPWVPAKRTAPLPGTEAAEAIYGPRDRTHRRGLGVYNLDTGAGLHPDAADALDRRQVKGEMEFRGGRGKAMVEKPNDHSIFHLGLAHTVMSSASVAPAPTGASVKASSQDAQTSSSPQPEQQQQPLQPPPGTAAPGPATTDRYVNNGFVFSSGYVDEANAIGGTPYVGSVRPQHDAPDYLVERQARSQWQATQRTRGTASRLNDDVHAVQQLPDW